MIWDPCAMAKSLKVLTVPLDVAGPPCNACAHWRPEARFDQRWGLDGVRMCHAEEQHRDFRAFEVEPMFDEAAPLASGNVVRVKVDSVVPNQAPPSVVWLRWLDEELHELPAEAFPPASVNVGALLILDGDDEVLTVPAIPAGTTALWSFWDAERGGNRLLWQGGPGEDIVDGIRRLVTTWWRERAGATCGGAGASVSFEFDSGMPEAGSDGV